MSNAVPLFSAIAAAHNSRTDSGSAPSAAQIFSTVGQAGTAFPRK
ncbi:hypothetical protein ACFOSC_05640 [Streptantibioticus rubrisoli]|nr:hypothetical protein [Streptantibioticus rubrisoli]